MFKIHITDSFYNEWIWYHEESMIPVEMDKIKIIPLEHKLFSGDAIDINENTINIVHSPIRNDNNIPGILLLTGKTYGRAKNQRFYYKCIPNDHRIPAFLLPYEIKSIGFNKNIINKFILFKYVEWTEKHPTGVIVNILGNITDLGSFYEYQLYCKNLFISIKKFTKNVETTLKKEGNNQYIDYIMQNNPNIENRLDDNVFTIDPKLSTDLDDGMSINGNIISVTCF